ncbi:MAG: T9SS type A sorting domain-containing protein [Bacteroidales bacterium]|nr:T9SS type A sorting domain-containing protein [Bacteroidales bacterium]
MLVGTVPYFDGHFLDEIGSDAAARTYQIVGVSKEGDDCPIASYRKGTIHTTYYEDVDGNLNMTWNTPYIEDGAEGSLTGYQICKYDPVTEEITVVDQINPSITDYTCNSSLFSGGTATIAAIFSRDSRSFSNRNTMLAVNENENSVFKVYPNPSNGTFTVEGATQLTIYNTLGQIITTSQSEDGTHSISLRSGIYFVKSGEGMVRKVVVE